MKPSSSPPPPKKVNANPKKDFNEMVSVYIDNINDGESVRDKSETVSELEIRFGTNPRVEKPLTKLNYDNVVKSLVSSGFSTDNDAGMHLLRVQCEYFNETENINKMSNIRTEIPGTDLIQEYCRTNNLKKILDLTSTISAASDKIKFTQKIPPMSKNETTPVRMVDFTDFNFRVSYQMERDFDVRTTTAKKIISEWTHSKKTFRFINRVRFSHETLPIFADISIVKSSKKTNNVYIPQYTIQDSGVLTNQEMYEIELEIDNSRIGNGTEYNTVDSLMTAIRRCIRVVLSGLQQSNYPISISEKTEALIEYMKIIHGEDYPTDKRVYSKNFIGPSSLTLQVDNLITNSTLSEVQNITENYTVTDKADGERRLLLVSSNSRVYMIDTNMNVYFTGMVADNAKTHKSILDGEFIRYDKTGKEINLYASFDVYYVDNKSARELSFIPTGSPETDGLDPDTESAPEPLKINKYRFLILNDYVSSLKLRNLVDLPKQGEAGYTRNSLSCGFRIQPKVFYSSNRTNTIFEGCSKILMDHKLGLFEYNIDGLIFTPTNTGVGSNTSGTAGPKSKITWEKSFKWKPPEFNTIDFLVSVKKDSTGKDEVFNVYQEGQNMSGVSNLSKYKTLILRCGFDKRKHGYINPFADLINGGHETVSNVDSRETYLPVPFHPINPYVPDAQYCNIMLKDCGGNNCVMTTEENEYFEENMIVEFKYVTDDESKSGFWRWIPIRVRHDKTSELRSGVKNYGNAYHVANNNWTSIHNPITVEMITTGDKIPLTPIDNDVYYNKTSKDTETRCLRDFHNLYVKRKLIMSVGNRGNTLIDYAVGKGGDLSKWISAGVDFVFGVDVSRDNIHNNLDGACARYLNMKKKNKKLPRALFVTGTSSSNIRNGDAFAISTEKEKEIAKAVFGSGKHDREYLGEAVYPNYGIAKDGFNISSVQFAIHYFFENKTTLNSFMRNLSECTKVGGHVIGTCYDGTTVFNLLSKENKGGSVSVVNNGKKIYELTKQYSQTGFPDDENSIGYAIDVYQESINKTFREYLVNYPLLVRMMENYGFIPITDEEAVQMGMPKQSALFDRLYEYMIDEIKLNTKLDVEYGTAGNMSKSEKTISFMNRYFIFRKERNVNTEGMFKVLEKTDKERDDIIQMRIDDSNETDVYSKNKSKTADVVQGEKFVIKRPRKLKVPKITIQENAASSVPEPEPEPETEKPTTTTTTTTIRVKKRVAATKPADK
jgi:hypothetical protein